MIYGRIQQYLPCDPRSLPPDERPLCDRPKPLTAPSRTDPSAGGGVVFYTWNAASPLTHVTPPPGQTADQVAERYARRQILGHPISYAWMVTDAFARFFAVTRSTRPGEWPIGSWQFTRITDPPRWHVALAKRDSTRQVALSGISPPGQKAHPPVAELRSYQRFGYVPGPVLIAAVLVSLLAVAGRRVSARRRWAIVVLLGTGILLILMPAATAGVDYRYLLPSLTVLPPAGTIGLDVLLRRIERAGRRRAGHRLPIPDQTTAPVSCTPFARREAVTDPAGPALLAEHEKWEDRLTE
jgi:hypothetical protein